MPEVNNVHYMNALAVKSNAAWGMLNPGEIAYMAAEATLAVAHELRTANILALRAQEVDANISYEYGEEIRKRLYG